jgi:membrane-associated protein
MSNFLLACAHLNPIGIIQTGGYLGIAIIIFAESGLLAGIFFPGDSLLFAAGLFSGIGVLSLAPLLLCVVVAAILGDTVGYWFGKNVGTNFFNRKDSLLFKREYLERTQAFYKKYGGRAVLLSRFVPIVRTIAPILAGIGGMKYRIFFSYNALGGILWGGGVLLISYFLGAHIPNAQHYITPVSIGIIVVSFLPIFINVVRGKRAI